MFSQLGAIQLDPLDPMGTNADLVTIARVDGVARGEVYGHLLPGHAFEHFAKERCLLPAAAFPYYREHAAERMSGRIEHRTSRLPQGLLADLVAEIEERGPVSAADLDRSQNRGVVEPLDWSGWKSTGRASSMALEALSFQCRLVVVGRTLRGKLYDVPRRALPHVHDAPAMSADAFERWAVAARVEAAGLLTRNMGPHWGLLSEVRQGEVPNRLIEEGVLVEVQVEGATRRFLAPADFARRKFPQDDGLMRILGPLDPLLWDRKLVAHAFGFDYLWEVYKPESERRWGWYVHPLLHRGEFVGRLEGRVREGVLQIDRIWREPERALDLEALDAALERHAQACGVEQVKRPKRLLKGGR